MLTQEEREKLFTPNALKDALRLTSVEDVSVILSCFNTLDGEVFADALRKIVLEVYPMNKPMT